LKGNISKIFFGLQEMGSSLYRLTPVNIKGIREKTRTGRSLGTNDFIERLEGQLKRLFKFKPKGRPKKKVDK